MIEVNGSLYWSVPGDAGSLQWCYFGVEAMLNTVLLNALDIYGVRLTNIEHNKGSFWPCTLVFSYNLFLAIGFITFAIRTLFVRENVEER